jgi:SAM-dependent methyltransferase
MAVRYRGNHQEPGFTGTSAVMESVHVLMCSLHVPRRYEMTGATLDFEAVKQRQQQTWATGDFAIIGSRLALIGETLCESVDLSAGSRVLDIACGAGTASLAAARRFGEVVGIDYVPALLERGRECAAAERLEVTFQEGDAENLEFDDASFDVVLSTFGIMFAPNQPRAAAEMLRADLTLRPTATGTRSATTLGDRTRCARTHRRWCERNQLRTSLLDHALPLTRALGGLLPYPFRPDFASLQHAR